MVQSLVQTAITAAKGADSYFKSIENQFTSFLDTALPFVWIAVAVAVIGIGLACIIGSDRSKEAAKSKFVYVVIGCALVLGAVYIAKGISNTLTVSSK